MLKRLVVLLVLIAVPTITWLLLVGSRVMNEMQSGATTSSTGNAAQVRMDHIIEQLSFNHCNFQASRNTIDLIFVNMNPFDLKDPEITCAYVGTSRTIIQTSKNMLYQVLPMKRQVEFKNFTLGYLHPQAIDAICRVTHVVPIIPSGS
jgi:hypothetical protein